MIFRRAGRLADRCVEVEAAVRDRDGVRTSRAVTRLWKAAEQAPVPELDEALRRCAALLPEMGISAGGQFSILCGALVERGARPDVLVAPVADGLAEALTEAERFRTGWLRVRGEEAEPPGTEDPDAMDHAVAVMAEAYGDLSTAQQATLGWFFAEKWALPATTLLQQSAAVRAAFRSRPGLVVTAAELVSDLSDLTCLVGLLHLLEREQLVVLHRQTGRGWRVTIDGIGDNFQLHTLLAGALSGPAERGLIEGLTVDPAWIAVATDAPPEQFRGSVVGSFNLVDGYGKWIWNEGTPADIPSLDGARLVVLDPPPYQRSWSNIRKFPMLPGSLTVDETLAPAEAAAWLAKVAPAGTPG